MALSRRGIYGPVRSMRGSLHLHIPNGEDRMLTPSQVFFFNDQQATERDFVPGTVVDLWSMNGQEFGYLIKPCIKEDIKQLNPKLQGKFSSFTMLPNCHRISSAFFAFLETAVITGNQVGLSNFPKLGTWTKYYIDWLLANFSEQGIGQIFQDSASRNLFETIGVELTQIQTQYYESHREFPYSECATGTIDEDTWLLHGLASLFDMALVQVSVEDDGKVRRKVFYPNTKTQTCPQILLYDFGWLHLSQPLNEVGGLNIGNYWPAIINIYEQRTVLRKATCIQHHLDCKDAVVFMEEGFTFISKALMQELKTIDGVLEQAFTYVCQKTASSTKMIETRTICAQCKKQSSHYLSCDHGICDHCLVFNYFAPKDLVYCAGCSNMHPCAELTLPMTPLEKREVTLSRARLTCANCNAECKTSKKPRKYKDRVMMLDCHDLICLRCLELAVRKGNGVCPVCNTYVNLHEEEMLQMSCKCVECNESKPLLKEFPIVACADHRSCKKCISKWKSMTNCKHCDRTLEEAEQNVLAVLSDLICTKCERKVKRRQAVVNENKECNCFLCLRCAYPAKSESLDILSCQHCKKALEGEKLLLSYYNYYKKSAETWDIREVTIYLEMAGKRKQKVLTCAICDASIPSQFDICFTGNCLHFFCKGCYITCITIDIQKIMAENLNRPVKCPMPNCLAEVNAALLSGNQAIINEELLIHFNEYVAQQIVKEYICGSCKRKDFINIEFTHFRCVGCGKDECVNCNGPWTEQHDQVECKFYQTEKMIKTMIPEHCEVCQDKGCGKCAFSQCPGCKIPYLKDDHCDHVKCLNPNCGVEFCFQCACYRSPTIEHCNTWHRRQCPNFPKDEDEATSKKIIAGEKLRPKCIMCAKLGKMCQPPINLAKPRQFNLAETKNSA